MPRHWILIVRRVDPTATAPVITTATGGSTVLEPRWIPDPTGRHEFRWWDGMSWTDHVADGQILCTDPVRSSPRRSPSRLPGVMSMVAAGAALIVVGIGLTNSATVARVEAFSEPTARTSTPTRTSAAARTSTVAQRSTATLSSPSALAGAGAGASSGARSSTAAQQGQASFSAAAPLRPLVTRTKSKPRTTTPRTPDPAPDPARDPALDPAPVRASSTTTPGPSDRARPKPAATRTGKAAADIPGHVRPGAFCAQHDATGVSATGKALRCSPSATDKRYRWRKA